MTSADTAPPSCEMKPTAVGTHRPRSLKAKAIRGSVWTMFGIGAGQVLRLGSNVALTRLLFPQAFGLMSLVNIFFQGLALFTDIGVGANIVQHKRGTEPVFLDTAWTIQVIRGIMIWLVSCALAYPLALFYGQPMLAWMIPVAGISAVIASCNPTSLHVLSRKLALGRLTARELAAQAAGIVVMIAAAWMFRSVWALVAGSLAGALCSCLFAWQLVKHKNWFAWDAEARKAVLGFGRIVFISSAVLFLANQSERLIMGKFIPLATLGVYSVALTLSRMGTSILQRLFGKVLFPVFAELHREKPDRVPAYYQRARRLVDAGSLGMALILIVLGPLLIRIMYDARYWEAAWMVQILGIQAAWDIMRAPASYLLLAAGKPQYGAWASASRVLVLSIGLPAVFISCEASVAMPLAVWIVALSVMPSFLIYVAGVSRLFPQMARSECIVGLASCAALPILYWILH